jgi:hypothetical protein
LFEIIAALIWISAACFAFLAIYRRLRTRSIGIEPLSLSAVPLLSSLILAGLGLFDYQVSRSLEADGRLGAEIDTLSNEKIIESRLMCSRMENGTTVCQNQEVERSIVIDDCSQIGVAGSCIDKGLLISSLNSTEYAFNAPEVMTLDRPETIGLVLGSDGPIDRENHFLGMNGLVRSGQVPLTLFMEAEIVGPAFTIEPSGRQRREVSSLNATRWDWKLTPRQSGEHQFEVSIFIVLSRDGQKIAEDKPLAARQVVQVSVGTLDYLIALAGKLQPLQAFLVVLIAGVGSILVWFGISKFKDFWRNSDQKEEPTKVELTIKTESKNYSDRANSDLGPAKLSGDAENSQDRDF